MVDTGDGQPTQERQNSGSARDRVRRVLGALLVVAAATALVAVVYIGSQLLGFVTGLVGSAIGLGTIVQFTLLIVVAELLGYGGASAAIVSVARRFDRPLLRIGVPTVSDLAVIAIGTVVSIGLIYVFNALSMVLGIDPSSHSIASFGQQTPLIFLVGAVLSIPVIGLAEELFFRGVIQDVLGTATPAPVAVVIASVLFSLPHIFSYLPRDGALTAAALQGTAFSLVMLFVVGLVLGAVYEYSDNLVVPAVVHGTFNGYQFLLAYVGAVLGLREFGLI
ncbi:MAG: lysostaphin resistance A-like protein [Halococcoides sp.]